MSRTDDDARRDGDAPRLDDVEELFALALAADPAARPALLDARCAGRAALRADVESLLAAHARAGAFLVPHTIGLAGAPPLPDDRDSRAGGRVGAFRLLQRIARGGMGEVYRAERVEGGFTQVVAIKLIAARIHDHVTVRRFQAERQILASLQHPHIVSLLDGGITPDGQPYIVMELVDGVPITEFCHARALSVPERLQLFLQACAAVAFAHRHLIVHRDLKPANVLVTNDGVVKVLDFGVATLLEPQAAEPSPTLARAVPLTPDYASPEQVRGLPTTTAWDVYALGVMLYELLAGTRPYDTAGKTLDDLVATVLHEEVRRPSDAAAGTLPYDRRRLRGDLDAIVLTALAKRADRRYSSAEGVADDVVRFLQGRPVEAREPSRAYLLRRLIGRHKAAAAVAAAAAIVVSGAVAGVLWQARVASRERERAVQRFNDVRELASALIFRIHDEVEPLAGSTGVRETIVSEGLRFLDRLEGDAADDRALRLELSRAYVRMGDVQGRLSAANLGDREGALRSYRKARDLAAAPGGAAAASWEGVAALAEANMRLSEIAAGEESTTAARAALAAVTAWGRREPDSERARVLLARAHFTMALRERDAAQLPHWFEANRLFAEVLAEDAANGTKMRNLALTEKYLGSYFDERGEHERALAHHRRAYALDERRVRERPDDRQALLDLAIDIGGVAFSLKGQARHGEAIAAFQESLAIRERLAAADPKDVYARSRVAFVHTELAELFLLTEQPAPAREHARRAVRETRPLAGIDEEHRAQHAMALQKLAAVDEQEGLRQEACRGYAAAVRAFDGVADRYMYSDRFRSKASAEDGLRGCS